MLCLVLSAEYTFCSQNEQIHNFFFKAFMRDHILPWKTMFHSWDSPRLLVCDTGLYLEQNDISFITVAICGGYISKYPRLFGHVTEMSPDDQIRIWGVILVLKHKHFFIHIALDSAVKYILSSMGILLKIRTTCHARDLQNLARSSLCPPDPWNLSGTASLRGF